MSAAPAGRAGRVGARMHLGVFGLAAMLAITAGAIVPGAAHAAQPFTMHTDATYRIHPDARRADVSVSVSFTNTTPDTPGSFSLYRNIPVTLQAGASAVAARDGSGPLTVTVAAGGSRTMATIRLRSAVRYRRTAAFTLTYRIADGASPDVRVRPSMIVLPVWCFGTSGSAAVELPDGLTARVSGAAMTSTSSAQGTLLTSGGVSDPSRWRALLTAARQPTYASITRSVPLSGGTVDLRVRSWDDDPAWGQRTLELAAAALPRLQQVIGLPFTAGGPLVITEALPAGLDPLAEVGLGAQDVALAFNAQPFTVLHQLAHVWISSDVVAARWIREGLASLAASRVATDLKVKPPYDPAAEAKARDEDAFPLDEWDASGAGQAPPTGGPEDAWAYAAAWSFLDRVATQLGGAAPFRALRRAAAGTSAYQAGEPGDSGGSGPDSLDSRQLLDQLEEGSGADLSAAFRSIVFGEQAAALLTARSEARAALRTLQLAAGPWGAPQPIISALERWRFEEADAAILQARAWLTDRDALVDRAGAARLTIPGRLAAGWRSDGGGPRAQAELEAERAVVDAYLAGRQRVGEPNPVQALGLVGGPRPVELLSTAAGLFAAGDLAGAVGSIERASELHAGAQAAGVVRLGVLAALVAVLALLATVAARRVRLFAARHTGRGRLAPPPSA